MPIPASAPVYLKTEGGSTGIQDEFSAANLAAASTAAGLDPLPTAMLDFLGLSSYTPQSEVYITPGTYYFTVRTGKPASQVMNIVVVGGGAGGGGSMAGSGYDGESGGYSGSSGGGGGGGAVVTHLSSAGFNNLVVAGQVLTIVVGTGGVGAAGISSENAFGPFQGEGGGSSSLNFGYDFFDPSTAQRFVSGTGGYPGRTANSNYRFTGGKLTDGGGGNSGARVFGQGGTLTAGYVGSAADWGAVDGFNGGGGGGAGSDSPGAPVAGSGYTATWGPNTGTYGNGGPGGGAFLNQTGQAGTATGMGGGGSASQAFYNAPAVSQTGGTGMSGGVGFYV